MIAEIGHFALLLALALALLQSVAPIWGARRGDAALMGLARPLAGGQFLFIAAAFAMLIALYVRSDYSVANVWQNSHADKPLLYKISGTWGNHEGSMLLWVMILAFFGSLVALFGSNLPVRLRAIVLAVQAWVATCAIGTPFHSWQLTAQGKSPAAHKGMVHAAKVMATTGRDLFLRPDLLAAARAEHAGYLAAEPYSCPMPPEVSPAIPPRA